MELFIPASQRHLDLWPKVLPQSSLCPSMITINSRALVVKYLLHIVDQWSGEPFGQQKKGDVGVVGWQAGRAQMWQRGFGTQGGEPVTDIECHRASKMRHIGLSLWTGKKHFFPWTALRSHSQQLHVRHCFNCLWFSPLYLVNQVLLMLASGTVL